MPEPRNIHALPFRPGLTVADRLQRHFDAAGHDVGLDEAQDDGLGTATVRLADVPPVSLAALALTYEAPHRYERLDRVIAAQERHWRALVRVHGLDRRIVWQRRECEPWWGRRERFRDPNARRYLPYDRRSGEAILSDDGILARRLRRATWDI